MSDVTVQIGDVIHVSLEDTAQNSPLLTPTVDPVPPTIDQLLTASRAAHALFQTHTGSIHRDGTVRTPPNDPAAADAVQAALNARALAEAADPGHTDPAWVTDSQANRGVTSDALVNFYRDYLG